MTFPHLEDDRLRLDLLQMEHTNPLWAVVKPLDIHQYGPNDLSTKEKLEAYIAVALENYATGKEIPFAIYDKSSNSYVGCTRFGYIDNTNKTLHIGWTWIAKEVQGTGLNGAVKHLMLGHAFGSMKMRKVVFRIDALNTRSRKAVEKLGAQLEGILKEDVYVANKRLRDSCCYAIFANTYHSPSA